MSGGSIASRDLQRLDSSLAALVRGQRSLGFLLRFEALVPLTVGLVVLGGSLLTLPPGPLCDDGMMLFLEGGCDFGQSNVFFFSKLGLLAGILLAWLAS